MQRHFEDSDALCRYLAERSDTVVLSFSLGKDSIGAWFQLQRYFAKIVPFYLYLVPDLKFVDESIDYYENFFKTEIVQLPHPALYRLLNNLVFQSPENCHVVEAAGLKGFSYDDIANEFKGDRGLGSDVFVAHGTRSADSIMRRTSIKKWGTLNPKRKTFLPVYDWNKQRLKTVLKEAGVRLPVDYEMFGRSFDGIDYRFLAPIRDRFPEDYKRILEFFPLAELEIKRREYRERYYGRSK